ncbi:hypothetical protein [Streptomyces sp. MK5]|uniref:hypothetical protein n=1 Tax=Streptomyces sp. MK5 TaxID=3064253 RepID=UPI0027404401|nr:hypothetical protein [Streptomyces sp. MK5]
MRPPRGKLAIHGLKHNDVSTKWSPDSGQVAAGDDAGHDDDHPGQCTEPGDSTYETQLTEAGQRQVAAACIDAFLGRHLTGDERFDAMLTGKRHPLARIASVDVTADRR